MLNLDRVRLSLLHHTRAFRSAQPLTLSPSTSSRQVIRRAMSTNPRRPDFGYYTRNAATHRSGTSARSSLYSSFQSRFKRHYSDSGRKVSGGLSADSAFWILFSLNAASFGAWWYARLTNNHKLVQLHLDNTLVSLASWDSGRWWNVITSAFAHHDPMHFLFNMISLRTFCSIVGFVPGIGGGHVLLLAMGSALCGSGSWLLQQKEKLSSLRGSTRFGNNAFNSAASQTYHASALGASGIVMGVSALATCLLPSMPISLMFIPIGIPLWAVTIGYAVFDTYFLNSNRSTTAHSGHLGGLLCGVGYYIAFLRHSPVGVWRSLAWRFGRK